MTSLSQMVTLTLCFLFAKQKHRCVSTDYRCSTNGANKCVAVETLADEFVEKDTNATSIRRKNIAFAAQVSRR